jgi:hypothetical protein
MFAFAHPIAQPRFTYTSADDGYSVYGWRVRMHRTAREFSTLALSGRRGFALSGSGSATVTTSAVYRPGRRYAVKLSGSRVARRTVLVTARRNHRLQVTVPLGPANPYQQDTPQAQAAGTAVYTTMATISRAPRHRR